MRFRYPINTLYDVLVTIPKRKLNYGFHTHSMWATEADTITIKTLGIPIIVAYVDAIMFR